MPLTIGASLNQRAGGVADGRCGVFNTTHRLLLELVHAGQVDGIRIDHVDGLYDPASYLERLRAAAAALPGRPVYIWIEKIVAASTAS